LDSFDFLNIGCVVLENDAKHDTSIRGGKFDGSLVLGAFVCVFIENQKAGLVIFRNCEKIVSWRAVDD
jgi:hypothetical protein